MLPIAINHMTLAKQSFAELLDVATRLGCCGVELRNDLSGKLFDGLTAIDAGRILREKNLRLLAIAEVKQFNDWSDAKFAEAEMKAIDSAAPGATELKPYVGVQFVAIPEFPEIGSAAGQEFSAALSGAKTVEEALAAAQSAADAIMKEAGYYE